MKKKLNVLQRVSVWIIVELHQKRISPWRNKRGAQCRFYPSCSNYGIVAITKYGFFKGWLKTMMRIVRCNPKNTQSCVDYPQ